MKRISIAGKAQTVLGLIDAEDLGVTLPHEHLLIDLPMFFPMQEPTAASERALAHQPVSLENLYWVTYNLEKNLDNQRLLDESTAVNEALSYRLAGGNTIVDLTNVGMGRDPLALRRIALATGLNIIMGCGYYVSEAYPADIDMDRKTENDIAEEIVRDLTVGVSNSGVCAGIIGEIGCTWPLVDNERKVLRGAALAQRRTGAPLNIHPGRHPSAPFEIIEILRNSGADISRTVISHVERTIRDAGNRHELAKTGCYIEYDLFGWEGYYPIGRVDIPNDAYRINELADLIAQGHVNQLLVSQDICYKTRLRRYGGHGYAHIIDNVVPLMRDKGIPEEHIHTITVENPKHMLQFAKLDTPPLKNN